MKAVTKYADKRIGTNFITLKTKENILKGESLEKVR